MRDIGRWSICTAQQRRVRVDRPAAGSEEPAAVGPVIKGVKVKILDSSHGVPKGPGRRIFIGFFSFEGPPVAAAGIIDRLMSSGDVGYFGDGDDLLYVSGRDDG